MRAPFWPGGKSDKQMRYTSGNVTTMRSVGTREKAYCQSPPRDRVARLGSLNNRSFQLRKKCDIYRFTQRRRIILKFFVTPDLTPNTKPVFGVQMLETY